MMTYKEFVEWCNERACDGCWGMSEAMNCIAVMEDVRKQWPWRREKYWKAEYAEEVCEKIVDPTNALIEKYQRGEPLK